MSRFKNNYAANGKQTRYEARERAGFRCIRCGSPSVQGKILTTHHFDGDKANDEWWNLMALCQVCHLKIQNKVIPQIPYFFEHTEWMKPYVAGFYAWKYEGVMLTREQVMERLNELLAYEHYKIPEPQK